jgi:hypothetical protein
VNRSDLQRIADGLLAGYVEPARGIFKTRLGGVQWIAPAKNVSLRSFSPPGIDP